MGSIQEMSLQIKNTAADILSEWGVLLLVFFLSLASFGLGRLSALESVRLPVTVYKAQTATAAVPVVQRTQKAEEPIPTGGQYVASKSGSAYYFPWCGGADRITEANKVWFSSEEAAKAAGYRPAKNCKGLSSN